MNDIITSTLLTACSTYLLITAYCLLYELDKQPLGVELAYCSSIDVMTELSVDL